MEINVKDLPGSIGGGGRYDNLIGMFLGSEVPACGFSLGLERILVVMQERGMFPPTVEQSSVDVVVAALDESAQSAAMETATELGAPGPSCGSRIRTSRRRWTRFSSTSISAGRRFIAIIGKRRNGGGHGDRAKRRHKDKGDDAQGGSGIVHQRKL